MARKGKRKENGGGKKEEVWRVEWVPCVASCAVEQRGEGWLKTAERGSAGRGEDRMWGVHVVVGTLAVFAPGRGGDGVMV